MLQNKSLKFIVSLLISIWFCVACQTQFDEQTSRIAFLQGELSKEFVLGIILSDGSERTQLDLGSTRPSCSVWSHDGQKLLFRASQDDISNVFTYDLESSQLTRLTDLELRITDPVWSPEDSQIAMLAMPEDVISTGGRNSIYVIQADGSNFERISDVDFYISELDWHSINDEFLTITHPGVYSFAEKFEFTIFDLNGNYESIPNEILPDEPIKIFRSPAWSPDGKQIAFSLEAGYATATADIYIMGRDGSNPVKLTNAEETERNLQPSWSPDGRRLAFVSNRHHHDILTLDIYTMKTDGSDVQRLTTEGNYLCPAWQP